MPNSQSDLSHDHIFSPVSLFRICPALAALLLGCALLLSRDPLHDFLQGMAFGLLLALSTLSVQLKSVTTKDENSPTDVQNLRMWSLRATPIATAILIALATFLFKEGFGRGFCLGLALTMLITQAVLSFRIKAVGLQDIQQPPDIEDVRIT
jgi:peptidoglycan/LPS O-acetylase OafA/YrhL